MNKAIRDYNHKVDKLVSTHPLGDFISVSCKTECFEVVTKDNQIGSNACGYDSDNGVFSFQDKLINLNIMSIYILL